MGFNCTDTPNLTSVNACVSNKLSTMFSTGLWKFPTTQCTDVDKSVDNLGKQQDRVEIFTISCW